MSVAGIWDVTIKTPMGVLKPVLNFTVINNKIIGTIAMPESAAASLKGGRLVGATVTVKGRISKPMPFSLAFTLHFIGNQLVGTCMADGRTFPVAGKRIGEDTIPEARLTRWKDFLFG